MDAQRLGPGLDLIYDYRSKALHESTPFPLPMCRPPTEHTDEQGTWLDERPHGSAEYDLGGVWDLREMPMLLWCFEYLTRGALLNWWSWMADRCRLAAE